MKWNYNNVPSTSREVLVAFRTNNGVFADWDKHVHYTTAQYEHGYGWSIPQNWEFLAWSDFDRLKVDAQGNRTEHNKLDVVGLGL